MGRDKAQIIVPDHLRGGQATPSFPDAPSDNIQYGRQNGTWTPTRQPPDNPQDGRSYCRVNANWAEVPPGTFVDAPSDGSTYGREDGAWVVVPPSIEEAPIDTTPYARQDAGWVPTTAGIEEAPVDGNPYSRQDAGWVPSAEFIDAPVDTNLYGRRDAAWDLVPPGIEEAPIDTTPYSRQDAGWVPAAAGIEEAPVDGQTYARHMASWIPEVIMGEAPIDGTAYERQDGAWVPSNDIEEAPIDGKAYARMDAGWSEIPATTWVDAPADNVLYGRQNNSWQPTIDDAPADGVLYGRQDNTWTPASAALPSDLVPLEESDPGNPGVSLEYSRADHIHPAPPNKPLPGDDLPLMDGVADPGNAVKYSRMDHVHPSDAPLPSDDPPIMDSIADPGVSILFARGDHVHPTDAPLAGTLVPIIDSVGDVGVSLAYSREDHVHPSDAPLPSDVVPLVNLDPGNPGISLLYSRDDHVHPHDPTRVEEAPLDNIIYGRINATWEPTVPEAPDDTSTYVRRGPGVGAGLWEPTVPFIEAPDDNLVYGRNGTIADWQRAVAIIGDTMTGHLMMAPDATITVHSGVGDRRVVLFGEHIELHDCGGITFENASGVLSVLSNSDITGALYLTTALELPYDPVNPLDAVTKQYVDNQVGGVEEAPIDGTPYARQDAGWVVSEVFIDAPIDGVQYGRIDATWTPTLPEAPIDGFAYSRQDAGWVASTAFIDAPIDTTPYSRQDADWVPAIPEAPVDGTAYSRMDAGWVATTSPVTGDYVLKVGDTMSGPLEIITAGVSRPLMIQNMGADSTISFFDGTGPTWFTGMRAGENTYTIWCAMTGAPPEAVVISDIFDVRIPLMLAADPVAPLEAATKRYVDNDAPYVPIAGGTMTGDLILNVDPTVPLQAATKNYVDVLVAANVKYLGTWQVAANTPDITAGATAGEYYICTTADDTIPETVPPGIPGIAGLNAKYGDKVIWDVANGQWDLLSGGTGLSIQEGDQLYVNVVGDVMSGGLSFGSEAATIPTDCSRHIILYDASTGIFGFSVTANTLNYCVDPGSRHIFRTDLPIQISNPDGSNVRDIYDSVQCDGRYLRLSGGTVTGPVNMRHNIDMGSVGFITNLLTGTNPGDAVNIAYVNGAVRASSDLLMSRITALEEQVSRHEVTIERLQAL